MTVRAKFKVTDFVRSTSGYSVTLYPVVTGSAENEQLYRYTPAGHILLTTINEEAARQFEVGKQFYVDFASAEE